ncbi:endonuclease/exonuclease/phosphatase family protein [Paenibacillus alkalitolerans]|uniref:endonuclease/exonuclease/phosphatase family protein n=1 Tax=Paenibacillus alkalitolerans TaxID=2799335 RepID=UPI0018F5757B|nr:endonuclease/exonuclease/phosphatase family protein [Paenibacillus alkalitolerans]
MQIKMLTFNIHHGRGADRKLNLDRIEQVIQESKADLIGLNEVDNSFSRRSGYLDQPLWLSERLNMDYAFGASVSLQSKNNAFLRQYGNALLSRYPIVTHSNHPFPTNRGIFEGRALLEADVQLPEQRLKVYVTHLSISPWKRIKQVEYVLEKRKQTDLPAVLMGDCNMRPGTRMWRMMSGPFVDVCHAALDAPCRTFPSHMPRVQLDYIFVSEHFRIESVEVFHYAGKASDHMPVKAALTVRGPQA